MSEVATVHLQLSMFVPSTVHILPGALWCRSAVV